MELSDTRIPVPNIGSLLRCLSPPLRALSASLLPRSCFVCGEACGNAPLCLRCNAALPRAGAERCPRCALASPDGQVCGACLADPPAYDATWAAFDYAFPARELVHALKFDARFDLVGDLAAWLTAAMPGPGEQVLVPIPLHPERLRARGFNQSALLARAVARRAGCAVRLGGLVRDVPGGPQAALTRDERLRNLRGAFRAPEPFSGGHVVVVDDVMTTGATLHEAALALKAAGAERVSALVVARTPPPAG